MIKWFIDCMTLGALLNVAAFIILMGIMKGRSPNQIGSALRTVCTPISMSTVHQLHGGSPFYTAR
jgi:hypothetical protein